MIKSYVENLKICQRKHSRAKLLIFQEECDAVVERLTQEKETTLDIDLKKMPSAMQPVIRSSPKRQRASNFVSAEQKRSLFESDEEDDNKESKSSPKKSKRKKCVRWQPGGSCF